MRLTLPTRKTALFDRRLMSAIRSSRRLKKEGDIAKGPRYTISLITSEKYLKVYEVKDNRIQGRKYLVERYNRYPQKDGWKVFVQ